TKSLFITGKGILGKGILGKGILGKGILGKGNFLNVFGLAKITILSQ
ncbi:MAG: hypothetical protein ACI86C_001203, partial [Candidatus Latescibacterota bacterium]